MVLACLVQVVTGVAVVWFSRLRGTGGWNNTVGVVMQVLVVLRRMEALHSKSVPCILKVRLYMLIDVFEGTNVTLIIVIPPRQHGAAVWLCRLGGSGGWRTTVWVGAGLALAHCEQVL